MDIKSDFSCCKAYDIHGKVGIELGESVACRCLKCIDLIKDLFVRSANNLDEPDGLSASFKDWQFNLRVSSTELLVCLNVETKVD